MASSGADLPLKRFLAGQTKLPSVAAACVLRRRATDSNRRAEALLLVMSQLSSGSMVVDLISSIDNSAVTLCTFTSEISA